MSDDYDFFPKFTKATENPRDSDDYFGKDEFLTRSAAPHVYEDMRGKHWFVVWNGSRWRVLPAPDAVAFYNAQFGTKLKNFDAKDKDARAPITADDAGLVVDGIEESIERWRLEAQDRDSSGSWWLLAALVFLVVTDKRRR